MQVCLIVIKVATAGPMVTIQAPSYIERLTVVTYL